jgi:hypothetical protein
MSFLDHQGESEFPFNKEIVFNAMVKAIPTVKGMKIDNADKLQSRIVVKAGVSLMSWGENIPIQLSEISENLTKVKITSTPKTGVMFGGAFDLGKNRKNIEQILSATSRILSKESSSNIDTSQTTEKNTSINQNSNNIKKKVIMEQNQTKKWYDNKFVVHLLLVIFFPVGLYALWKTDTIAKWWKITATVLIGLIVIANLGDDSTSTENSTTEKTTIQKEPEIELTQAQKDSIVKVEKAKLYEQRKSQTVSAKNLYASYEANEVSADQNFKGKTFYITGIVDDIKKNFMNDIYVTLKTGKMFTSVHCYLDDEKTAAKLKKGQRVTFRGKCDGMVVTMVTMKDCEIAKNLNELK